MVGAAESPNKATTSGAAGSQARVRQQGAKPAARGKKHAPVRRKAKKVEGMSQEEVRDFLERTRAHAAAAEPSKMEALAPLRQRQVPAGREHEREPSSKTVAAGLHVPSGDEAARLAAQLERVAAQQQREQAAREEAARAKQRAAAAQHNRNVQEFNALHLKHHGRPAAAMPPALQGPPPPPTAQGSAQPRPKRKLLGVSKLSKACN